MADSPASQDTPGRRSLRDAVDSTANPPMTLGAALAAALDLFDFGLDLMRQNLRRADPNATDQQIDERLTRWLHDRPGAETGDGFGRPIAIADRSL